MGLGGLGVIAEGVVLTRYEANIDQAKAKVKELSGEQRKAAKEAVQAFKEQGEAWKKHVGDFAKGAAVVATTIAVAKSGIEQYRKETALTAGAAGVDIDRLADAWGGLKTRMDLLTFAQAGHRGAWKLTTSQLEQVTAGMRALEAQGFESGKVFDRFTEVIKKGKLEGLDEFGISIKSTGDQAKDLQILMRALGREVSEVGGDFSRATDPIDRATVQWANAVTRVRLEVGRLSLTLISAAEDFGKWAGKLFGGSAPEGSKEDQRAAEIAQRLMFAQGRTGSSFAGAAMGGKLGSIAQGAGGRAISNFVGSPLLADQYNLFGTDAGTTGDAKKIMDLQGRIRQGKFNSLAGLNEFDAAVKSLPAAWSAAVPELDGLITRQREWFASNMFRLGVDSASAFSEGFAANDNGKGKNKGRGRGGGGRGAATASAGPGLFFGAARRVTGIVDDLAARRDANDQASADAMSAYQDRMSQRFADAQMVQDIEAGRSAMAKQEKQSFLERTFGKLEEFDAYAAGFDTLKTAVQSGFAAWIDGSESLGTAIKKSIAQSLGAYAVEMSGRALVAGAHALFNLATGDLPGAAAMGLSAAKYAAAAVALGALAKGLGGGGSGSSVAASAAGVGGRPNAAPTPQSGVVIVGDPLSDDSPRERARRVRRAMRSAGRDAEGVRYG